jgi:hypothetical protein
MQPLKNEKHKAKLQFSKKSNFILFIYLFILSFSPFLEVI